MFTKYRGENLSDVSLRATALPRSEDIDHPVPCSPWTSTDHTAFGEE